MASNVKDLSRWPLILAVIQFTLFFVACCVVYYRGIVNSEGFPYNTFLPTPPLFGDYLVVLRDWSAGNLTTSGYGRNYFPGLYLFVNLLTPLNELPTLAIVAGIGVPLVVTLACLFLLLIRKNVLMAFTGLLLVATSYPVLLMLETGNLELWVLGLVSLALWASLRNRWRLFAILIGVAASFKVFPFIFLLVPLVLIKQKVEVLRVAAISFITAVALTVAALLTLKGGFLSSGIEGVGDAVSATLRSLELYKALMWFDIAGMHFGHSLLNAVHAFWGTSVMTSESWGIPIQLAGLICGFLVALCLRGREVRPWQVWVLAALVACIFAPTSTDYKLIYFVPAFVLLLIDVSEGGASTWRLHDLIVAVSFPVIFAPKPWGRVSADPFSTAQVWLTAIVLILDFCVISIFAINAGWGERKILSKPKRAPLQPK